LAALKNGEFRDWIHRQLSHWYFIRLEWDQHAIKHPLLELCQCLIQLATLLPACL
jgi:hypothetical protein